MYATNIVYRAKTTETDTSVTPNTTKTTYYPLAGYGENLWYIWSYTVAWLVMIVGWLFTFWMKHIWYTYDKYGALSYQEEFDWFGLASAIAVERGYLTNTVKEAEEAEEEEAAEEDEDEEPANDDDTDFF